MRSEAIANGLQGLSGVAPHDPRRTRREVVATKPVASWSRSNSCLAMARCKRQRYLGCKQRFRNAVNDYIGLEPAHHEPHNP